jgi:hypothetical protein
MGRGGGGAVNALPSESVKTVVNVKTTSRARRPDRLSDAFALPNPHGENLRFVEQFLMLPAHEHRTGTQRASKFSISRSMFFLEDDRRQSILVRRRTFGGRRREAFFQPCANRLVSPP